jgi:hypothetical protein
MLGVRVDGVDCGECYSEEVYLDVKAEPSMYKVGAYCSGCDHDYGVLTRISRSEIESVDEVFDIGEESVTDLLDQD